MNVDNKEYIKFSLGYRRLAIVLSTAAFIAVSSVSGSSPLTTVLVSVGMLCACFLGEFLYRFAFLSHRLHLRVAAFIATAEFVLYGFALMETGGFYSPYLWYCFGIIPILLIFKRKFPMVLCCLIYFGCAAYGLLNFDATAYMLEYLVLSISIGILLFFLAFININIFIQQIATAKVELQELNKQLLKKSDISDMAISSSEDARDVLKAFGEQNADSSLYRALMLFKKLTGAKACILVKFGLNCEVEHVVSEGLSEEEVCEFLPNIMEVAQSKTDGTFVTLSGYSYRTIRNSPSSHAVVVYPESGMHKTDVLSGADRFCVDFTKLIMTFIDNRGKLENSMILEEKRRIAEEIHDTILQKIFVVTCTLNSMRKHPCDIPPNEQNTRLKEMEKLLHTVMQELRDTIYDVRSEDDADDLNVRLHRYAEVMKNATDASISLCIDAAATREMTEHCSAVLYRVLCEAVNNAVRHAKASEIVVSLTSQKTHTEICVQDDGVGFDTKSCMDTAGGLKNMSELVSMLEGTIAVKSHKNKGTSIEITVPND